MGKMLFVILVDFQLKSGMEKQFRALIDANADASVRDEPGCLQFDVLEPEGEAGRVLLYEIYCDRAAFEAHLKTGHFRHGTCRQARPCAAHVCAKACVATERQQTSLRRCAPQAAQPMRPWSSH